MSAFYDKLKGTAAALLARYGRDVTIRQPNPTDVYDPAQGGMVPGTPIDTVRKGALLNFGAGATEVRGNLVQVNDRKLLVEAGTFAPKVADRVLVGSSVWEVLSVSEVTPAGTAIIYELHLRQ